MKLVGQTAGLSDRVKDISVEERQARLGVRPDNETFGQREAWLQAQLKPLGVSIANDGGGYVATMTKAGRVPLTILIDCFGDAVAWLISLERKAKEKSEV